MTVKGASLSGLQGADGSSTCECNGYTVIGSVNGPIEVQRRDALPEEAAIEVNVRPAVGVGSPTERHLEALVQSTIRQMIIVENYPRTLIQVTLQILGVPASKLTPISGISILPALLQASLLALLSASIPLTTTFTSTAIGVTSSGNLISGRSLESQSSYTSFHVFTFTSQDDLLLAESEGSFDMETWEKAYIAAGEQCYGRKRDADNDIAMDAQGHGLQEQLKTAVRNKVEADRRWKIS